MDKPIYNVIVSEEEDDNQGGNYISLVFEPASQVNYLKFNEDKIPLKFDIQEDKQIISGPIILVDKPMYRNQPGLVDCYVVFSADQANNFIKKMARQRKHNEIKTAHEDVVNSGISMLEFYTVDRAKGKGVPQGFEDVKDGSIWGSYLIDDKELWKQVKAGEFNGFSPEGSFGIQFSDTTIDIAAELVAEIQKFHATIKSFALNSN